MLPMRGVIHCTTCRRCACRIGWLLLLVHLVSSVRVGLCCWCHLMTRMRVELWSWCHLMTRVWVWLWSWCHLMPRMRCSGRLVIRRRWRSCWSWHLMTGMGRLASGCSWSCAARASAWICALGRHRMPSVATSILRRRRLGPMSFPMHALACNCSVSLSPYFVR